MVPNYYFLVEGLFLWYNGLSAGLRECSKRVWTPLTLLHSLGLNSTITVLLEG